MSLGSFPIDPGVHPPLGHTAVYDLPSEHWRAVPDVSPNLLMSDHKLRQDDH